MAFILTRLNVGDYTAWKPMFDQDVPRAQLAAAADRASLRSLAAGEPQ